MAAKRHLHETSINDQPEPKRDRQAHDVITSECGNVLVISQEPEHDRSVSLDSNDLKIPYESEQNAEVLGKHEPEYKTPVESNLPVIEVDDGHIKTGEVEVVDVQIEDASPSAPCPQQRKGNSGPSVRVSQPKSRISVSEASADAGLQGHPKSRADPSAGSFLHPHPCAVAGSSSKANLLVTQKNAAVPVKKVGPEKCAESSAEPNSVGGPSNPSHTDIVHLLAEDRFWGKKRTVETENIVLRVGRPTPILPSSDAITDPKMTVSLSKFTYQKIPWLTGSKSLGKYFCWPCLLFSTEEKWSLSGSVGWKQSSVAILNHQLSSGHVSAFKILKQKEESLRASKPKNPPPATPLSTESIRRNRRFFELLIRILCSKKTKPQNTDMDFDGYEELMKVAISHDPELKVFSRIQLSEDGLVDFVSLHTAKLLVSIEHFVLFSIRKEIAAAPHLCIIYEDTQNVVDKVSLVAVIVRYVDGDGEICERFLKFVKLAGPRTASNIHKIHSSLVNELGLQRKLVGFSYSGTVVYLLPLGIVELNDAIRRLSPKAKYFHCPDHNFKELLLQSLSHVVESRQFFQVIGDLVAFFSTNSGAIPTLVNFVKTNDPKCPWLYGENSFTHDMVSTIKHSYPLVLQFFERVSKKFWNDEVVRQAPEFVRFLSCHKNKFLIAVVSAVLGCVDELSCAIERQSQPQHWTHFASSALSKLRDFKKSGETHFMVAASDPKLSANDSIFIHPELPRNLCHQLFHSIIDTAINCVTYRCLKLDSFHAGKPSAGIADVIKDDVMTHYAAFITGHGLRALVAQIDAFKPYELIFHKKTLSEQVKLLIALGMKKDFFELYKFLRFSILVAPPERNSSDSTISKLKAYVKDKQTLSSTEVLLYLEKGLISRLMEDGQFFDDVIDYYAESSNEPVFPHHD